MTKKTDGRTREARYKRQDQAEKVRQSLIESADKNAKKLIWFADIIPNVIARGFAAELIAALRFAKALNIDDTIEAGVTSLRDLQKSVYNEVHAKGSFFLNPVTGAVRDQYNKEFSESRPLFEDAYGPATSVVPLTQEQLDQANAAIAFCYRRAVTTGPATERELTDFIKLSNVELPNTAAASLTSGSEA